MVRFSITANNFSPEKRLPIEIKVNSLLFIVKLVPIEQNQFQEHINVVLFAVDIARKL